MKRSILLALLISSAGRANAQLPPEISSALSDNRGILSLVVSVKDSILYTGTFNGRDPDELFNNQSLTKNVEALLIGIAIDKGLIPSAKSRIADFLPELKNDPDERKQAITIGEVMDQASGLWHEDLRRLRRYLHLDDPSGYVWSQPLVSPPGSEIHYNNAASHLLSVILSRASGQSTLEFANDNLFEPLGIGGVEWPKMKDGYHDGSGLLAVRMRTIDMHKLGRLILNNGKHDGERLISQEWIRTLLKPAKTYPAPWELPDTRYGRSFYHTIHQGQEIVYGMGWGGQFLILIPELDAVVSVNQRVKNRSAVRQSNLFMGEIFPLLFDWIESLAEGSK